MTHITCLASSGSRMCFFEMHRTLYFSHVHNVIMVDQWISVVFPLWEHPLGPDTCSPSLQHGDGISGRAFHCHRPSDHDNCEYGRSRRNLKDTPRPISLQHSIKFDTNAFQFGSMTLTKKPRTTSPRERESFCPSTRPWLQGSLRLKVHWHGVPFW